MATAEEILAKLREIQATVDRIPDLLKLAPAQIITITGLSDIDSNLGLIKAGEFRSGNNRKPGEGFSGVRIGWPAMYYPSTSVSDTARYNIVGIDADTLQFGLRSSDGAAVFGAGAGVISVTGLSLVATSSDAIPSRVRWLDTVAFPQAFLQAFMSGSSFPEIQMMVGNNASTGGERSNIAIYAAGRTSTGAGYSAFILEHDDTGTSVITHRMQTVRNGLQSNHIVIRSVNNPTAANPNKLAFNDDQRITDFIFRGDSDVGVESAVLYVSGSTHMTLFGSDTLASALVGIHSTEASIMLARDASSDIETPLSDQGKIWVDTAGEARLSDTGATGSTSWYLPRSADSMPGVFYLNFATRDNAIPASTTGPVMNGSNNRDRARTVTIWDQAFYVGAPNNPTNRYTIEFIVGTSTVGSLTFSSTLGSAGVWQHRASTQSLAVSTAILLFEIGVTGIGSPGTIYLAHPVIAAV